MKKLLSDIFRRSVLALGQTAPETYRRAVIRSGPEPGIRFTSGLSVCDEALRNGHWVSRYWLSSGMVKPENHLDHERAAFGNCLSMHFNFRWKVRASTVPGNG